MIGFHNPQLLFLLFLIPIIIVIHLVTLVFFSKKAFKFANFETLKRINNQKKVFSKRLPQLFLRIIFFSLIVIGIAQPYLWVQSDGISDRVIFAVDVSGSMLADDFEPTRLDATKEALISFIQNNTLDAGLISFASVAYPEKHLTKNNEELISAVENLKIRQASGTSLGQAVNYGIAMLYNKGEEGKVIVLTDGQENVLNEDELKEIAEFAASKKVIPYFIGIASRTGGQIKNMTTGVSVLNEDTFKILTQDNGDYAIALNKQEIQSLINEFLEKGNLQRQFELSLWFYMAAFIILIIEWYMANYFFRSFP